MKCITYLILSLVFCHVLFSCKKKEPIKPTACKIERVITYVKGSTEKPDSFYYRYGDNGKIDSIARTNGHLYSRYVKTFEYHGSGTIKTYVQFYKGPKRLWDSITLNNQGQIVHVYHAEDLKYNGQYEYNSAGERIKSSVVYLSSSFDPQSVTIEWQNGNAVKTIDNKGNVTTSTFRQDISFKNNDKSYVLDYLDYGIGNSRSKNLRQSTIIGSDTIHYLYEFDNQQRITKAITRAVGDDVTEIQYTCP
jgi:hypothetical protein